MGTPLPPHRPVLLREALELLRPAPGRVVVDATLGAGGHAEAILEALGPTGRLYGIDRDPTALALAGRRLTHFGRSFRAVPGRYEELVERLRAEGVSAVDGVLADLGVSSMQLDDPARGFSVRHDGPLDMRMDPRSGPTAADLLASLSDRELARILRTYGEERRAGAIARAIVRRRERSPLARTRELAELVERVAGPRARGRGIHPATRTFQALRIAVNGELERLAAFVADAVSLLRPGGRFVAIAFHSLEDRAIKHALRELAQRCVCPPGLPVCGCGRKNLVDVLTPRPIRPGADERDANPRARSARLRAAEKKS